MRTFAIGFFEGNIHTVAGATGIHTSGVREVGTVASVAFAEAADGSLANVEPVAVRIGEYGESRRNVLSWSASDRHHGADPHVFAAAFSPARHVELGGHTLVIEAGELVIPASALV